MTKIQAIYEGDLRCKAVHDLSSSEILTDAPLDNCGKGESFSPTDLVATALLTCMATIMGIAAKNSKIDICNFDMSVEKKMSVNLPRRISDLVLAAPAFICRARPRSATTTLASHWQRPVR